MDQFEMSEPRTDAAGATASTVESPAGSDAGVAVVTPPVEVEAAILHEAAPTDVAELVDENAVVEVVGHRETAHAADAADAADIPPIPRWSYAQPRTPMHFLTVPSLGPVGRRRHPLLVGALCLVTLGGYAVAWHRRVNREASDFDARVDVAPAASALAIFVPWWAGFVASVTGAILLTLDQFHHPVTGISTTVMLGLLAGILVVGDALLLFPLSLVATVMTLERVRGMEDRVGIERDQQIRPVARLAVLVLPLVGLIWHVASVQRRLNAIWTTVEPQVGAAND